MFELELRLQYSELYSHYQHRILEKLFYREIFCKDKFNVVAKIHADIRNVFNDFFVLDKYKSNAVKS